MKRIFLFVLSIVSNFASAAEQHITCPARYPLATIRIADVPEGWDGEGQVSAHNRLIGAGFFLGSIEESSKGEMIGVGRIKTKDGYENRFPIPDGVFEKWVVCRYGNSGNIELYHRVTAKAKHCVIRTKVLKFPEIPTVNITCN